jgi:hypothetical protein
MTATDAGTIGLLLVLIISMLIAAALAMSERPYEPSPTVGVPGRHRAIEAAP